MLRTSASSWLLTFPTWKAEMVASPSGGCGAAPKRRRRRNGLSVAAVVVPLVAAAFLDGAAPANAFLAPRSQPSSSHLSLPLGSTAPHRTSPTKTLEAPPLYKRDFAASEDEFPELLTAALPASAAGDGSQQLSPMAVESGEALQWRPEGLPRLSRHEVRSLHRGERVQRQTRVGAQGTGMAVVDVKADIDLVMSYLSDYKGYESNIDTVRTAKIVDVRDSDGVVKAEFSVSRFRLAIHVLMRALIERNIVEFELDPDCSKLGKQVLKEAKGFWFVEQPKDRAPGYSRVWMLAKVDCSKLLPGFIIEYAARRALPRATTWLKPALEAAQRRRIREPMPRISS